MERLKRLVNILRKKQVRVGGLILLFLLSLTLIYTHIPAPRIESAESAEGSSKVSFDAPFTIRFTQAMSRTSVETAFKITPEIQGHFDWADSKTLEFVPESALTVGDHFQIKIAHTAKSIFMRSMDADARLTYLVSGPPYVKFVSPRFEEETTVPVIDSTQVITVMFDRPMLMEDLVKDSPEETLLVIQPSVKGEYRALGQSAFQFIPREWPIGTRFSLSVPSGIQARDGGETEEGINWTVETPSLQVSSVEPTPKSSGVDVMAPIRVHFNQEVDLDKIRPGINSQLFPSNDLDSAQGAKTDGFFNTEAVYGKGADGKIDKRSLVFTPSFPYLKNTDHLFVLKAGLPVLGDEDGKLSMKADYELAFKTGPEDSGETDEPQVKTEEGNISWVNKTQAEFFRPDSSLEFLVQNANVSSLSVQVCQVTLANFLDTQAHYGWQGYNCMDTPVKVALADQTTKVTPLDLNALYSRGWAEGIYFISVETETGERIQKNFLVSDTALIVKKSEGGLLVWASDLITGEPVSRMEMVIYGADGEEISRGVTDGQGIYKINRVLSPGISVLGHKDLEGEKRWTFSNEFWRSPIFNEANGDPSAWIAPFETKAFVTVNKTELRPGETVKGTGLLRVDDDASLTIPEIAQVVLKLEDLNLNEIVSKPLPVRRNGSFDASFQLPLTLNPGEYRLSVYFDQGEQMASNEVMLEIKKEDVPLKMEWLDLSGHYPSKSLVNIGLKAFYTVNSGSTDSSVGLPASNIKGHFDLYRKAYHFDAHQDSGSFSYGSSDSLSCLGGGCDTGEKFVSDGEFTFDLNGTALISLSKADAFLDEGFEYYLKVKAETVDGKETFIDTRFDVDQGEFYNGLSLKHYIVNPDETSISADILSADLSGQLIEGKKIKVTLVQMEQDKEAGNWYTEMTTSEKFPVSVEIPISAKMPGGLYRLRAESEDEDGHIIRAELPVYRVGDKALGDRLTIYADQPEYFVGGKAHLIINSPSSTQEKPLTALVTYERAMVIDYQIVRLTAPLTRIEIPVSENMMPNVHIGVIAIKRPDDVSSILDARRNEVQITLMEQELSELKPDEDGPQIKDLSEKIEKLKKESPDVSLGLGGFEPISAYTSLLILKPEKSIRMEITTVPEAPEPGQDVTVKIHTFDYQNRDIPAVISLNIADIKPFSDFSSVNYFYSPRPLQVMSWDNIVTGQNAPDYAPTDNRLFTGEEIGASAYFNPLITTDANGLAEVSFPLPDKPADWKILAQASSDASSFGYKETELKLLQRLSIQPLLPAFIVYGDQIRIGAQVKNLSVEKQDTALEILSDDLRVSDSAKKNISLEGGESETVYWDVSFAPDHLLDDLKIAFRSREDLVSRTLSVLHIDTREKVMMDENSDGELTGSFSISDRILNGVGKLTLTLSASPADALDLFQEAVQTSRFASTELLASRLIAESVKADEKSDQGLQALADLLVSKQRADGGFVYWGGAENSDAWLTAYSLYALVTVRDSVSLDDLVLQRAIRFLWKELSENEGLTTSDRYFILWALSEAGQFDTAQTLSLFDERESSSLIGNGFLLMNISNLVEAGQKGAGAFRDRLMGELASEIETDETSKGVTFFGDRFEPYSDDNLKNTGILLFALAKSDANNPLLEGMVRFVFEASHENQSRADSQTYIWGLLGLSEYLKGHQNESLNYIAKVKVNGDTVMDQSITDDNASEVFASALPLDSLKSAGDMNQIMLDKKGTGSAYVGAELNYVPELKNLSRIEDGLLITRAYYELEDFAEAHPVKDLKLGKMYRGVITLALPEDMDFVAVEEPLPAGVKALALNPHIGDLAWMYEQEDTANAGGLSFIDNPIWHFDDKQIEDSRILLFARKLPAGVYKADYLLQAGLAGQFNHLPATLTELYQSEHFARTEAEVVEIE